MKIEIPELSLVTLIGVSGSGKSTFAKKHFLPTEIVSVDHCRELISDSKNSFDITKDAFDLSNYIIGLRLKSGKPSVADASNINKHNRRALIRTAKDHHVARVALVFNLPLKTCLERNSTRKEGWISEGIIKNQYTQLQDAVQFLKKDGFKIIHIFNKPEDIENVEIVRTKLPIIRPDLKGPFDIIGDIHGCISEFMELLQKLGYQVQKEPVSSSDFPSLDEFQSQNQELKSSSDGKSLDENQNPIFGYSVTHPKGRKVLFVGDFVDRGPASNEVLRMVMSMTNDGIGLGVIGNHDDKLLRYLNGAKVKVQRGLENTLEQLENEPPEFIESVKTFLEGLASHYVLDDGKLILAHAGLREELHYRDSNSIRSLCMYGETTGKLDERGLPVRLNWPARYKGDAVIVFGHTPIGEPDWHNNTIDIDTGCVYGGKLTALRYPEMKLVSVKAKKVWSEPSRPIDLSIEEVLK